MKRYFVAFCIYICPLTSYVLHSQSYSRADTIPVKVGSTLLKMPWVGGHNFCQFSDIDMNFDGIKDLFVFDRTAMKVTTYINKGTANTVDYVDSTRKFAPLFPHLEDWTLLRDYNCDGKTDIFTYSNGGVKVWKNTSAAGNLQFTSLPGTLKSAYCPAVLNLTITGVDIPSIDDIDGDGDLDILSYEASGINVQYHVNQSKELGYNCDSLIFSMDCSGCWGNYRNSISGCNVVFGTCKAPGPDSLATAERTERHPGNCTLCMDMDADGDKEVIIGQLACCNMVMLTNGGSAATANMVAMDDSFPNYDVPAILTSFPCGYFVDVNNDNKRDLIVSPNSPNVSIDKASIWYYLNTGADNAPVFSRQTRALFQEDMIDVGEGADAVFFDYNSDGLTDLLVSNYIGVIDTCPSSNIYGTHAYKNIGTPSSPKFELSSSDFANLSVEMPGITSKHLTFGDLDNDGDMDMCSGDYDGYVYYFQNTAGAGNPVNYTFVSLAMDVSTGNPLEVGNYSTPQLIDADRDGKLDLIIGERSGNLNYYRNIGTASSFSFTPVSAAFGGVDVLDWNITGYSVPFMYDSAGSYRLLVASEASRNNSTKMGWIWKYTNIDGNLAGNFSLVDSMYQNIWEGNRMTVHGKDINNDGSLDLAIGNYTGGVAIYLGDTTAVSVSELDQPNYDFTIYPNPSSGQLNITISGMNHGQSPVITIYNVLGEQVFQHVNTNQAGTTSSLLVDISTLPQGIYSLSLGAKGNQSSISKKLILIK